jgi:hypothetical protein
VTLQLLWEEYKQANPSGYAYSWYCELYREWQRQVDVVLRQEHRARGNDVRGLWKRCSWTLPVRRFR